MLTEGSIDVFKFKGKVCPADAQKEEVRVGRSLQGVLDQTANLVASRGGSFIEVRHSVLFAFHLLYVNRKKNGKEKCARNGMKRIQGV